MDARPSRSTTEEEIGRSRDSLVVLSPDLGSGDLGGHSVEGRVTGVTAAAAAHAEPHHPFGRTFPPSPLPFNPCSRIERTLSLLSLFLCLLSSIPTRLQQVNSSYSPSAFSIWTRLPASCSDLLLLLALALACIFNLPLTIARSSSSKVF